MVNAFQSTHVLYNRLYLSELTKEEISQSVHAEDGTEYEGAGIRSYGKIVGAIMSLFGLASKLTVGDETFYINNKSFSKCIIRLTELKDINSASDAARKLNEIYLKHKKSGYDAQQVRIVNKDLKQILKENKIKDINQMCLRLNQLALHRGKAP